jgi:ribosomal-protein-alanine N-acetyltransferase
MESTLSAIPDNSTSIQPASWRDVNAVNRLERICFPKDMWPIWDIVGVLTLPNVVRLKAVRDESIVGFAAVDQRYNEKIGWIATLGVLPEYRRQGIASALIGCCEKRAGLPSMKLSVRVSNQPAIDLYRNHGYKQVGIWSGYYLDREDALVLEKQLH